VKVQFCVLSSEQLLYQDGYSLEHYEFSNMQFVMHSFLYFLKYMYYWTPWQMIDLMWVYTYTHTFYTMHPSVLTIMGNKRMSSGKIIPIIIKNVNSEDDDLLKDPQNMFISYFIFIKPTFAHTVYTAVQFLISSRVLAATHHHQGLYTQVHLNHNKVYGIYSSNIHCITVCFPQLCSYDVRYSKIV
jgi:hypothetical protein